MASFLFVALIGLACYAFFKLISFVQSYIASYREYMEIDGEPHSLLWGHLRNHQASFPVGESSLAFLRRCCQKFEWRPYRMMIGPFKRSVVLSHPDDLQAILKTTEPKADIIYSPLKPWLGQGLLIITGPKWLRNRRLLTPAFHFNVLKSYAPIFTSTINTVLKVLATSADSGRPVDVFGVMSRMTLDTLLQCAMSYKTNCQTKRDEKLPYVDAVLRVSSMVIERELSIPHQSDLIYALSASGREFRRLCKYLHEYSEALIRTRRKELEQKAQTNGATSGEQIESKKHRDFIDILLEARDSSGVGMTDTEIRNEVDTFLFGGHDTTACASTWALYLLAKHPEHQAKIREEVKNVLGNGCGETQFAWESLNSLTYITQCIKETLRLFPSVPTTHRDLTEDLKLRHHTLRKGQWIMMNYIDLHRNPNFWDDPDEFKPERMELEAYKNRHPYAFLPFAAGPRNCIGQQFALNELRMALARIVTSYQVELVDGCTFDRVINIVLKPVGGQMLRFKHNKN